MAVVPTSDGNDLALSARIPLIEGNAEQGAVITVSSNFGLLYSASTAP